MASGEIRKAHHAYLISHLSELCHVLAHSAHKLSRNWAPCHCAQMSLLHRPILEIHTNIAQW
jgi:hypothetical protein